MTSIFIQIAAYRDKELLPTIRDALSKAVAPNGLSFGVVWQASSEEAYQWKEMIELNLGSRIRVIPIDFPQARGVGFARNLGQQLWEGETYTLQIDAHARFVQNWDLEMISMVENLKSLSRKPLLTSYAPAYEPPSLLNHLEGVAVEAQVSRLAASEFDDNGVCKLRPGDSINATVPQLGAFVSGHFIFTEGAFVEQVPYDPDIYFMGEEISMAARAWTSGYDIYHPHKQVIFHFYTPNKRVRHWEENQEWIRLEGNSVAKVKALLGVDMSPQLVSFGLGDMRTLRDYETFSGVSFSTKTVSQNALRGYPQFAYTH